MSEKQGKVEQMDQDGRRSIIYFINETVTYYEPINDFCIHYAWIEPIEELSNKDIQVVTQR